MSRCPTPIPPEKRSDFALRATMGMFSGLFALGIVLQSGDVGSLAGPILSVGSLSAMATQAVKASPVPSPRITIPLIAAGLGGGLYWGDQFINHSLETTLSLTAQWVRDGIGMGLAGSGMFSGTKAIAEELGQEDRLI